MALWSGRFTENVSEFTQRFGASLPVDKALYAQDIAGSKAHAAMLGSAGVIAQADADAIVGGLERVQERIEAGEFLETAVVHGMAHYGTPLEPVREHLAGNVPTILEIDLQGARRVKERAKELGLDVVYVFIAPPSFDELKKRLIGRGTETPEQQAKRLETAKVELAAEPEFDVTIVNEQVDKAARDLWNVIAQEYGLPQDTD